MIIDYILIAIGLFGLLIASLFDIKTREVPDWISYSLILSGLSLRLLYSLNTYIWSFLLVGVIGFLAMFLIGDLMYYTKQWGGGDTKILMGLGALYGTILGQKFFLLSLLVNILIVGAFYGLIWSIILAIINRKKFMEKLKKSIDKKKRFNTLLLISILIIVLDILFIKNYVIKAIIAIIFSLIILYYYLSIIVKAVEDSSLYKIVPVSKLTEGDWVSKNIRLRHRLIYRKDSLGIDKKQINLLKKSKIKRVEIKEGIPFIPSIFLATLATLLFGNLMSFLF
tara:strand:- start:8198 stop:9043 length:846 start_codon:yes stop_codon:yes gene_type:complete